MRKTANFQRAFGLTEVLIATAVFGIMMAAVLVIVQQAISAIGEAQVRATATALARDQIELSRNVGYIDLGTVGGIPSGTIPPNTTENVGGLDFEIRTFVVYVDDDFDGVAPADLVPADYKRVRVEVTWGGVFKSNNPVVLWSDIAPKGIETLPGTGVIMVSVMDANASASAQAEVRIQAPSLVPPVDMTAYTDDFGRVVIPGAPICDACYQVSATKTGYTSDRTYSTAEVANPVKENLSVLEGLLSNLALTIDLPASVTFKCTRGAAQNYNPFAGVNFNLVGSKMIGTTVTDEAVYLVNSSLTCVGGAAQVTLNNLVWDSYTVSIPTGSSVDFAGSWPLSPVTVLPGSNQTVNIVVNAASANTLLITALDATSQPLASVSAELLLAGVPVATKAGGLANKGDWSQIFFPSLSAANYNLRVVQFGYQDATASVNVSGDTREKYILNQ